jgi:hypothetical protein
VPDGSVDFAADSERQVVTKRLWQRFCKDNCEVLRKEACDLNNPRNSVAWYNQSSHAAVRAQHRPMECQRRTVAKKQSSAAGQKEVFKARLRAIFEEVASPPVNEFAGDRQCNRQFTIISNTDACNYQLWRLEEDPERKADLFKLLPLLGLIELLEKPLPRYLEDMGAPGIHPPARHRKVLGGAGLTPAGYYPSGTFEVHDEEPDESDYSFLEGKYAGETILLK